MDSISVQFVIARGHLLIVNCIMEFLWLISINPPTHTHTQHRDTKKSLGRTYVVVLSELQSRNAIKFATLQIPLPRIVFIIVITAAKINRDADAFLPVRIGHSTHGQAQIQDTITRGHIFRTFRARNLFQLDIIVVNWNFKVIRFLTRNTGWFGRYRGASMREDNVILINFNQAIIME